MLKKGDLKAASTLCAGWTGGSQASVYYGLLLCSFQLCCTGQETTHICSAMVTWARLAKRQTVDTGMGYREAKSSLPFSSTERIYVRRFKEIQDSRYNVKEKHRRPNCTYTLIKVKKKKQPKKYNSEKQTERILLLMIFEVGEWDYEFFSFL